MLAVMEEKQLLLLATGIQRNNSLALVVKRKMMRELTFEGYQRKT